MLSLSDFSKNEISKVLVEDDEEFQQEMFAQVKDINEENLTVNYLIHVQPLMQLVYQ